MSNTTELEGLLKEKEQFEKVMQSLDEEEKYLGKRFRIVEVKVAIQELKEKVKAKRAVVEQLRSKVKALEERLNEPSTVPKAPTPQVIEKVKEPEKKESIEVMVEATPADSQQPENKQEEKRRRFFP